MSRRSIDVWCDLVRRSDLNKAHKVVAWALSSHMDNETLEAWPSLALLAEEANVARSTVQAAVKALTGKGMLDVTRGELHREPNGTWRRDGNRYRGLISPGTENRVPKTEYRKPGTEIIGKELSLEPPIEPKTELVPNLQALLQRLESLGEDETLDLTEVEADAIQPYKEQYDVRGFKVGCHWRAYRLFAHGVANMEPQPEPAGLSVEESAPLLVPVSGKVWVPVSEGVSSREIHTTQPPSTMPTSHLSTVPTDNSEKKEPLGTEPGSMAEPPCGRLRELEAVEVQGEEQQNVNVEKEPTSEYRHVGDKEVVVNRVSAESGGEASAVSRLPRCPMEYLEDEEVVAVLREAFWTNEPLELAITVKKDEIPRLQRILDSMDVYLHDLRSAEEKGRFCLIRVS